VSRRKRPPAGAPAPSAGEPRAQRGAASGGGPARGGGPASGPPGARGGAAGGPPRARGGPDAGRRIAVDVALLVAVFAVTAAIAELAGAANLGVALGVGQVAFAIALVALLIRG
jgi:hypothetical protein